jgi:cytochrome P450
VTEREASASARPAATGRDTLPVVDLAARDFWEDPAAALAGARERSPLARTPGGQLLVLRYAEVEHLLQDASLRTVGTDPPEHTRLRTLVSRAFTARRSEQLAPAIRLLADELLDDIEQRERVDFVEAFADRLPIRVICALLGVPREEHDAVADCTRTIGGVFTTRMDDTKRAACESALDTLREQLLGHIELRRRAPADDLLGALVAAEDPGDRLSSDELVAMVVNLLFAGHDTTRGLFSFGLASLLQHPHQLAALRGDPALMPRAVEEMLRFESPTLGSLRAPAESTLLGGVEVAAGEPVNLLTVAANRDPLVFSSPDRFDVRRDEARHLSFGLGLHHCLGAALARSEARVGFAALLERFPRLELDLSAGERVQAVPFATIRQLRRLPIVATPA